MSFDKRALCNFTARALLARHIDRCEATHRFGLARQASEGRYQVDESLNVRVSVVTRVSFSTTLHRRPRSRDPHFASPFIGQCASMARRAARHHFRATRGDAGAHELLEASVLL